MGKIATTIVASGKGWKASDVVCTAGPQDRPYEERHGLISIALVLEGIFQYRGACGAELMSPGSVLLDSYGRNFECCHEHSTGDRCIAFQYAPEYFEDAGSDGDFAVHRIPPVASIASLIAAVRIGAEDRNTVIFSELANEVASSVLGVLDVSPDIRRTPSAADERRIAAVLKFIEGSLGEPLPSDCLASVAKMSEFHFLRVFKQVVGVTPHQYILRARLRDAAMRLKSAPDPVIDVALKAGFADLSNFNHAFRSEYGVSPNQFRTGDVLRNSRI